MWFVPQRLLYCGLGPQFGVMETPGLLRGGVQWQISGALGVAPAGGINASVLD